VAVRERLVGIRGIGRWTADIYLLMALGRPDVWPRGDSGFYAAYFRDLGGNTLNAFCMKGS
jgi:DNA-3-methyladenine glycosylase II